MQKKTGHRPSNDYIRMKKTQNNDQAKTTPIGEQ